MKRHPVYGGFPIAVDQLFVRCFSQKRLMPQSKASSEIVLDSQTRLMWTRKDNGKRLNWCEANQSAKELDLEGYRDWRLPSLKELHQLWDQHSRCIRKPFELTGAWVWSATRDESDYAWCFYYVIGIQVSYPVRVSYDLRALFVRDVESARSGLF